MDGWMEGWREGGIDRWREGGREGRREREITTWTVNDNDVKMCFIISN